MSPKKLYSKKKYSKDIGINSYNVVYTEEFNLLYIECLLCMYPGLLFVLELYLHGRLKMR